MMKSLALCVAMIMGTVSADAAKQHEAIDYEKNYYDEEEYFKDIPDLINKTQTNFTFQMIRWTITGFERGMYNDSELMVNEMCFGDYYVTKLNEYEYLFQEDPFGNIWENVFPEISLTYQFFYMGVNECDIDTTINDFMVFCWYKGCWPRQMLSQSLSKILYVLRALNDAAIVWYEGIPEEESVNGQDIEEWAKLSEQSGLTLAQVIKDLTDFAPIPKDQRV